MGTAHYLSDCGKLLIAQGGESPGRLDGPGAGQMHKQYRKIGAILIIQMEKRAVPEIFSGVPES